MNTEVILLRLGELTLKGKNRSRFENQILQQIRRVLAPFPRTVIVRESGRIAVELNGEPYEPVVKALEKVFGLTSFSPALKVPSDLKSIQEAALAVLRGREKPPSTFKISVRRVDKKFPHPTLEMNHLVGAYVLKRVGGLKVDVHRPELEISIEIREKGTYVFADTIPGPGGFPLGSNGKAMLMLSGGIDSPVAGWLAMKRGLKIEAVHFHSYPFTSERAKQKVIELAEVLADYAGKMTLHLVPFTDIQTRLKQSCRESLLITLMRRAMLRITEAIALKRDALAIVTGESLGQVASQTLASMNVINRAATLPVLRPLITMDKSEIIRYAEKIDTFRISIQPYEDCCTLFVPKSPATNPFLPAVERMEARMDWLEPSIREAVERTETIVLPDARPKDEQMFF